MQKTDDVAEVENWSMPAKILPSHITTSIGALRQYLISPPSVSEDPKSLIQKKRKRRARLNRRSSDGEEEDDGAVPRRQRKKKVVEVQNYKSAAFIDDSDDEDEDADRAFFEKEAKLREDMMRLAEERAGQMMAEMQAASRARGAGKSKGKGKIKRVRKVPGKEKLVVEEVSEEEVSSDSDVNESESEDDSPRGKKARLPRSRPTVESDEEDVGQGNGELSEAMIGSESD
jgi:replication fork protection complex subunit Tof1/Swi1